MAELDERQQQRLMGPNLVRGVTLMNDGTPEPAAWVDSADGHLPVW